MRLSRRYMELVEDIARETEKVVSQAGFKHARIETPKNTAYRSIDILAWSIEDKSKRLFIKVALDTSTITSQEYNDLCGAARMTGAKPLLVSEYDRRIDLQDDVVYKKSSVPLVNVRTLKPLLKESSDLYIISVKGDFYVRINGLKLRIEREKRGLSLGELARILGVSRKAVYEYERNTFDASIECGEKLIELFGEEITRPYSIFKDEELKTVKMHSPDNKIEEKVINVMESSGGEVYHAKRAFADLFIKARNTRMIIGVEHKRALATIEEKMEELEKLREFNDLLKVIVVDESRKKRELSSSSNVIIVSKDEVNVLRKLANERGIEGGNE